MHREELQDPLLDLLDVVVVLVQDRPGAFDVAGVLGQGRPRQAGHPIEIGPDDRGLGGIGMAPLQPLDLFLDLRGRLGRDLLLPDDPPITLELLGELLSFAELLLDRPQLLAQVVLALRTIHLAPGLRRDLLLHRENRDLAREVLVHEPKAFDRVGRLEDPLRFLELELQVRGGEIGEPRGIGKVRRDHHHLGRDALAERHGLLQVLLHAPHERLVLGRELFRGLRFLEARDFHFQVRLFREDRVDPRARDALHEQARAAVRQLQHPHDRRDGSDRVQVGQPRQLGLGVSLGDQHDDPLLGERRVDGVDRPLPRDGERQDDVRKDDDVLQRQDRKNVGDRKVGVALGDPRFFFELDHGLAFLLGFDRNVVLFLAQVGDARQHDLEQTSGEPGLRLTGVHRPRESHRLHERTEVALHAEEADAFPRTGLSPLGSPDGHHPSADAHLHVRRFDARELEENADPFAVVDDVHARVPGRGRRDDGVVALDEEGKEPIDFAL